MTVTNREGSSDDFPCQGCHEDIEPGSAAFPPKTPHRRMRFDHVDEIQQCGQCHSYVDMDRLQLISGKTVGIGESHVLCGQCHAAKKKDWDIGAHGKQIGAWAGSRFRYTCTDCHDAHAPARAQVDADPPPAFPKFGIRKQVH